MDLNKLGAMDAAHAAAMADVETAELPGEKLGKIWVIAKPFLQLISRSFFIPKKWKEVALTLVEAIDEILPPITPHAPMPKQPGADIPE